ncbi:putative ABC transport system transmembrane protein [Nostocoides japonicum T1-X7]|uniref:Putative ABC transport system transmembrane protein n=1 Tax=Nostocoides japonicum T1-X7 TaxID=1194083 RepID=A0A077M2U9_9MICO|nr:ABC transporter permease [Tetrasphaera japonica]CCH78535.1 putative ABC transport system transmembrane protein [Tetrasphaera japonica T1-X7]
MYVAWRELRAARGRFVLVGAVVALITLLVGFLSGLTGGLASQSVSAVLAVPTDRIVLAAGGSDGPLLDRSSLSASTATAYRNASGTHAVRPLGISQLTASRAGTDTAVAVIGGEPGWWTMPARDHTVVLSRSVADDLHVAADDSVSLAGDTFTVEGVVPDLWYSHTPVVAVTITDWRGLAARTSSTTPYATALAVEGSPDWASLAATTQTVARSPLRSVTAVGAFRGEIGSLALIIGMLVGISALVVGAFFAVWAVQRRGDVAVLKALGASRYAVLRDAMAQALVVLVGGVALGLALVAGLGLLARSALPFVLNAATTLAPGLLVVLVGVVGAALSLRPVLTADPLTALGSAR